MLSDTGMRLMDELKGIWDNRDFVTGAMTNAGTEEAWEKMLDYILISRRNGESVTSDEILALSLKLGGMQ